MRTRLFLRTSELLWQEGHIAYTTEADARDYARQIYLDVYRDFMVDVLAMPVLVGRKTRQERFAGAVNTLDCEAMMRDGKALQMGTSHELGQSFAAAFDIGFHSVEGLRELAWTTSWGVSTRMIGGLIMAHGDDAGLRVPLRVAHIEVVVVVIGDGGGVSDVADRIAKELIAEGVRARVDNRTDTPIRSTGRRLEPKGVAVRIEVGARHLANGEITVARRDSGAKANESVDAVAALVPGLLEEIQATLLAEATAFGDARTADVTTSTRHAKPLKPASPGSRGPPSVSKARPCSPATPSLCGAYLDPTARCPTRRTSRATSQSLAAPTDLRTPRVRVGQPNATRSMAVGRITATSTTARASSAKPGELGNRSKTALSDPPGSPAIRGPARSQHRGDSAGRKAIDSVHVGSGRTVRERESGTSAVIENIHFSTLRAEDRSM